MAIKYFLKNNLGLALSSSGLVLCVMYLDYLVKTDQTERPRHVPPAPYKTVAPVVKKPVAKKIAPKPRKKPAQQKLFREPSPKEWRNIWKRFEVAKKQPFWKPLIRQLRRDIQPFRRLALNRKAISVNTLLNRRTYIHDDKNWNERDMWESPVEFLAHGGDCEDYAIAKMASLIELGVPSNRLYLYAVRLKKEGSAHMILAMNGQSGGMLAMDNRHSKVLFLSDMKRIMGYEFVYKISYDGTISYNDFY